MVRRYGPFDFYESRPIYAQETEARPTSLSQRAYCSITLPEVEIRNRELYRFSVYVCRGALGDIDTASLLININNEGRILLFPSSLER